MAEQNRPERDHAGVKHIVVPKSWSEEQREEHFKKRLPELLQGVINSSRDQSMTIELANSIFDGIEAILLYPERAKKVGLGFRPISQTGASSRLELAQATFIVTAQFYQFAHASPERMTKFDQFAVGAGNALVHVLILMPCMPDPELQLISTLEENSAEFVL